MNQLIVDKIFKNFEKKDITPGCVIASISKENPNYYYHWTRDASIVMRSILREYKRDKHPRIFKQLIDFINVESELQRMSYQVNLGEPKFNIDLSLFREKWGRPQNDGPALRGLLFLEMRDVLSDYSFLKSHLENIILQDTNYIVDNIQEPCFDLWEEIMGYHLYTRGVQYKFLKTLLEKNIFPSLKPVIEEKKNELYNLLQHHNITYTSFSLEGIKCREYDTSLLLLATHVDYDPEIVDIENPKFRKYLQKMLEYYQKEYRINNHYQNQFILLGRYENDVYFGGNPWIISSLAFYQLQLKYQEMKLNLDVPYEYILNFKKYLEEIPNLNISEQVDKNNGKGISARNLTWNYAEMLTFYKMLDWYKNKI